MTATGWVLVVILMIGPPLLFFWQSRERLTLGAGSEDAGGPGATQRRSEEILEPAVAAARAGAVDDPVPKTPSAGGVWMEGG